MRMKIKKEGDNSDLRSMLNNSDDSGLSEISDLLDADADGDNLEDSEDVFKKSELGADSATNIEGSDELVSEDELGEDKGKKTIILCGTFQ